MFRVVVALANIGEFEKFSDAFKLFMEKIKELLDKGTSYQVLETTNFIVSVTPDAQHAMSFYEARDFAYDVGLLVDGKLQAAEEPSIEVLRAAFSQASFKQYMGMLQELSQMVRGVTAT